MKDSTPFRWILAGCCACLLLTSHAEAFEDEPEEDAIIAAIDFLEGQVEETADVLAQAKIRLAIRELEEILDSEMDVADEAPALIDEAPVIIDVKPAALKKLFKGRAAYDTKIGVLSLTYDFARKDQLKDFEFEDEPPRVAEQALWLTSGEKVQHLARFKSVTIKGLVSIKIMRLGGIASTNGTRFTLGGNNADTIYLQAPGAGNAQRIVPGEVRAGTVPFQLSITPSKVSLAYANEKLAHPNLTKDDLHQIVLEGCRDGYGFSKLTITGVPDPKWFQEFLEAK